MDQAGVLGMRCGLWEFSALVRHAALRNEAEHAPAAEAMRTFGLPAFLTADGSPLPPPTARPESPAAVEASLRAKGWIDREGRLSEQWGEALSVLTNGSACGFLLVNAPDGGTRAAVAVHGRHAFRVVVNRDSVDVDEVPARASWYALARCLPAGEPVQGKGMTLPAKALAAAEEEAERHDGDRGEWASYELQLRRIPAIKAKVLGSWTKRADRTTARISVALRGPDASLREGPFTIDVHRSPSGRVAVFPQLPHGEQTTVAPGSTVVVARAVQQYVDDLRERLQPERASRGAGHRAE